jgi:hypothetical protein
VVGRDSFPAESTPGAPLRIDGNRAGLARRSERLKVAVSTLGGYNHRDPAGNCIDSAGAAIAGGDASPEFGDARWVIRVRAREAQAFDVVEPGAPFVLRLHRATLSERPSVRFPSAAWRWLRLPRGVELRVTLADRSLRVRAAQGESPAVVRLTITSVV